MTDYLKTLTREFEKNSHLPTASAQKAYMKNRFEFYGLTAKNRRALQHPFLDHQQLPDKSQLNTIVKTLWKLPQREYHYFAQELAFQYTNQTEKNDIQLFEFMVKHQSWWDTVDYIATKLIAAYFKTYSPQREQYVLKWLASDNIWLQRSALLFQLKYKQETDTELLRLTINRLLGSKEFFINKAIGWVLREFSKINPEWVLDFVRQTELNALSKKEALRRMN